MPPWFTLLLPYFFASATDFWIAATFDSPPQQAGQSDLSAPLSDARITSFVCGAIAPSALKVKFTWRDTAPKSGKTSYYYVRGEQANGELVWVSPMWITYTGK